MSKAVCIIIPARLASKRFPSKALHLIAGLPMVEHVRRRCLLSKVTTQVYVATCDEAIAQTVKSNGGDVIMTSKDHLNGTSRVAEAVSRVDCDHVILVQGDEPLLLPDYLLSLYQMIKENPFVDAWNVSSSIENDQELNQISVVKCAESKNNRIVYCSRKNTSQHHSPKKIGYLRKLLGLMAYRKDFLKKLVAMDPGLIEVSEDIEQMRIIENGFELRSLHVSKSLPSVNEPHEITAVMEYLQKDQEQMALLQKILVNDEKVTT